MTTPFAPGVTVFANIQQGFGWEQVVILGDENETPYNLTGWTVRAQGKRRPSDADPLTVGATITDASAGEVTLDLDEAATAGMATGKWGIDLVADDGGGERIWVRASALVETPNAEPAGD